MVRPRRNEFELLFIWVREFWLPMELWKDDAGETEYIPNPREEYITPVVSGAEVSGLEGSAIITLRFRGVRAPLAAVPPRGVRNPKDVE